MKIKRNKRMVQDSLLPRPKIKIPPKIGKIVEMGYSGNTEMIRPLIEKLGSQNRDVRQMAQVSIVELLGINKKKAQKILFLYGFNHKNPLIAKRVQEIYNMFFRELSKK